MLFVENVIVIYVGCGARDSTGRDQRAIQQCYPQQQQQGAAEEDGVLGAQP
jgi:hypothetical protein